MGNLKKLIKYIKAEKFRFLSSSCCSIINKTLDVLPEVFLGTAVDIVSGKTTFLLWFLGITSVKLQLIILSLITVIAWLLESISEFGQVTLWKRFAQIIQYRLRLDAFWHIEQLSMEHVNNRSPGEFATIINDDVNQIERFFDEGFNAIIHFIVGLVIVGFIFARYTPVLALLIFIPMPFIFLISFFFQKHIGPRYWHVRKSASTIGALIANDIVGLATIKSYSQEKFELARLKHKSKQYAEKNRQVVAYAAAFTPAVRMLLVFGFTATTLMGGFAVLNNSISVGTYSMLIFLTQKLLWPFISLPKLIDLYQRSMASADRVFELIGLPLTVKSGTIQLNKIDTCGVIQFQNVSFSYPNGLSVFKNLSLCIAPHTTVAFIGSTGSGKSTLAKLILRLYPHFEGQILFDEIPIQDYNLTDLRKTISYVSQDVFLIDATIAENIAYGKPGASQQEIEDAAKYAQAYNFIMKLPEQFDTLIGENGNQLSGGQKQRIGLARALIRKPAIYIFDEITAAVDNETEKLIQESLDHLTNSNTVIIIAHRLSTVRNANIIYVLDHGKIVESGTHEQLLQQNGLYKNLWKLQTGQK